MFLRFEKTWRAATILTSAVMAMAVVVPAVKAKPFDHRLRPGARGPDVKALQVRIAGWYPTRKHRTFSIDGIYGRQTKKAMRAFEAGYGRPMNGVASRKDLRILNWLQDRNGSTKHFDFREFVQNRSSSCSSRANAYAGTFSGGRSSPQRVKQNVRRLMWRLEAVRRKGGGRPIGINSGFRSVAYNNCIAGARASQHLYGTAADNRMVGVRNRREREIAKRSQIHGIACYSSLSHNHFDLRIENKDLRAGRFWWWPRRDRRGRDLTEGGSPCWGQGRSARASGSALIPRSTTTSVLHDVRQGVAGAGSLVPSLQEIELFEFAGEGEDMGGLD
jgi:uncharacterized protein YcbK (DUF882 family)